MKLSETKSEYTGKKNLLPIFLNRGFWIIWPNRMYCLQAIISWIRFCKPVMAIRSVPGIIWNGKTITLKFSYFDKTLISQNPPKIINNENKLVKLCKRKTILIPQTFHILHINHFSLKNSGNGQRNRPCLC